MCSTCGTYTKNKERIQKFKETEDSRYIYQIKLDKNLEIYLENSLLIKYYVIKHLTLLKIQNMIDINVDLLQWLINFLMNQFKNLRWCC